MIREREGVDFSMVLYITSNCSQVEKKKKYPHPVVDEFWLVGC